MAQLQKAQTQVELQAPAHVFHQALSVTPSQNFMPKEVQNFTINGNVMKFDFVYGGNKMSVKLLVEKDDSNYTTTWTIIEGDLAKHYKNMKITIKATPCGTGSVLSCTMEYEKINQNSVEPQAFIDFFTLCTKSIDSHIKANA